MNPQLKRVLAAKRHEEERLKDEFIRKNVPRFHRLMMEKFPNSKRWYDYGVAVDPTDPTKFTLLRGKKVVARNF